MSDVKARGKVTKRKANRPATKKTYQTTGRKPPAPDSSGATVLYLYAISRDGGFTVPAAGVDGSSIIEPLACSGLVCWFSQVSHREFGERLNEHMQNLDWLAAAGVRHQQAVAAIAEHTDVLPARFATVFLSAESLARHVREHKDALLAAFQRIHASDEWGVKVFAVVPRNTAPAKETQSGREYLQRKAATLRVATARRPDPELDEFASSLERASSESLKIGSHQNQPGLEWQGSFLVPRNQRKDFLETTTRYAERWSGRHRIECTGPWPPYSFIGSLAGNQQPGTSRSAARERKK